MQFLPKSFLKLLRDCKSKIECFKDDRRICFCTRTPQIVVIFTASNGDFNGSSLFAFFFEIKGYFAKKKYPVILVIS